MAALIAMSLVQRASSTAKVTALITVLLTAAVATGCARLTDGTPVAAKAPMGAPIDWGKCDIETPPSGRPIPSSAECGELTVPVDHAKPDGNTLSLALIKFPATGAKIGSLLVNPGGPGESGVTAAASMVGSLPDQVRERFDLVGFDPRGVASSTPAVWCNSDADNDRLRSEPETPYTPEGVAYIEQLTKDFIQRCVDKVGTEFLANVGTASVVKDLDMLRQALGDQKLTYLGYSYGTRIGGAYAEAYPQNVRAMILDGAVDPNADPIEADIRQSAAFQKAFDDYAADCAKSPDCPLGTDPSKAVAVYKDLVDPLGTKSGPTSDPRGLSYSDAVVGTIIALYSPDLWRYLTEGLTDLKAGKGDTMLTLADLYMGRNPEGKYSNSTDARVAVNCVDQPPVTDRAKLIDADRRSREVAPFLSYGSFTGNAPLGTCAFWPVPPTTQQHQISVTGLPPILVVSITGDPATPYQAGVDLAKQLGGTLVTFEGTQHTVVFQGNKCVDDIATRYLIDVVVPPAGTRC